MIEIRDRCNNRVIHTVDSADLSRANLYRADLYRANLYRADLSGADLRGTLLDADTPLSGAPNGILIADGFKIKDGYVYGWRTRISNVISGQFANEYEPGKTYTAPWFSWDFTTDCHPGLYLCPTEEAAKSWHSDIVRVRAKAGTVLKVGEKYRCRELEVLEVRYGGN